VLFGLAAFTLGASFADAAESNWPRKALRVVIPCGAGGDPDFNARTYGKYIKQFLGRDLAIVNIGGNGGALASEDVKKQKPDGYNALFFHSALNINLATGMTDYGAEAFEVCGVVGLSAGEAIIVRADAPYNTMMELIEYSKKNPNTVKIAANTGATSHWGAVVINVEHGAALNIVNAGGSAERTANLLGGHVDVAINPIGVVQDYVKAGQLKYLAVTTSNRLQYLPDVPTCLEQGVKMSYDLTYYLMMPKGTPREIVQKFGDAFRKVAELPEYAEAIKTAYNQVPFTLPQKESIEYIEKEKEAFMKYSQYFK
jgi:tripartite-type tricarboxylate transporter receptor subunit TctC